MATIYLAITTLNSSADGWRIVASGCERPAVERTARVAIEATYPASTTPTALDNLRVRSEAAVQQFIGEQALEDAWAAYFAEQPVPVRGGGHALTAGRAAGED